jgi:AI-2E family transporter
MPERTLSVAKRTPRLLKLVRKLEAVEGNQELSPSLSTLFSKLDALLRPLLIGGAVRLPFVWILLGIFGGINAFGLVGLFLGPAIVAALITLWRDLAKPTPQ